MQKDFAAAAAARRKAVTIYERLVAWLPNDRARRRRLADFLNDLSLLLFRARQEKPRAGNTRKLRDGLQEARDVLRCSLQVREELARQEPNNAQHHRQLADGYLTLKWVSTSMADPAGAAMALQQHLDHLEAYAALAPEEARKTLFGFADKQFATTFAAGFKAALEKSGGSHVALFRAQVARYEASYRAQGGGLDLTVDLVGSCFQLMGSLDVKTPEGIREVRRTLTLAQRALCQLRDKQKLHPVQARQLREIEARLRALPADPG
jgi:hypothetical protein